MDAGELEHFHHIRLSTVLLALRLIAVTYGVETLYAATLAAAYFYPNIQDLQLIIGSLWLFHTLKYALEIALILAIVLPWANTRYYLSGHHVVIRHGVLTSHEHVCELRNIRSVACSQSWIGKLLNYGDVTLLIGASGFHEDLVLKGVVDPEKYEELFEQYLGAESRHFLPEEQGGAR